MGVHSGRVAVITGAARGIGQATAVALAAQGAATALLDLADCAETSDLIAANGGKSFAVRCDVADEASWAIARETILDRFGGIQILINNAGIYPSISIDELDLATWDRILRVNLTSQFLGIKAVLESMKKAGWGRIVNIASSTSATGLTHMSHYMASKMGVVGLTRGLANDLGVHGITVNAVAPALTRTPGTAGVPDAYLEEIAQTQCIKRVAQPVDIVGPILFLTTDEAMFVTGQTVTVDGGMTKG